MYIAEFALGDPHFSIFEQELVMLYNDADSFVYPSLYEGFAQAQRFSWAYTAQHVSDIGKMYGVS